MKFLLFNIVVAGALVFLFAGDRDLPRSFADRARTEAAAISAKAADMIGISAPEKAAASPTPAPPAAPAAKAPSPAPKREPAATPPALKQAPKPEPVRTVAAAEPDALPDALPGVPPEVAKRRAEVLGAAPVPDASAARTPDGEPARFMSPEDRRRDLLRLSEEMEIFSATTIGQ